MNRYSEKKVVSAECEELVPYSSASKNIELTYAQWRRLPSGEQENHSQLLIKSTVLIKYTLLITYN